ncbi:hypothetical protein ENBRE01_2886 [Enteropsectra breve]|nr:hypothetical protein ENBRE01_2886 [Enteropsectra breve]
MSGIEKLKENKTQTINDLKPEDQEQYRKKFINDSRETIKKHLGFLAAQKLKHSYIGELFLCAEEIEYKEAYLMHTDLSYTTDGLEIPGCLVVMGKILEDVNMSKGGVFRVNSTEARIKLVRTLVFDIVEKRVTMEDGLGKFKTDFSAIDAAEVFKKLLRSFNITVVPEVYLPLILEIQKIENEDEKKVCTRAFLLSLPPMNRCILENCVFLCYLILEKLKNEDQKEQHMDIDGVSVVMMPNLFLKSEKNEAIENILALVDFTKFIFKNFIDFIKV